MTDNTVTQVSLNGKSTVISKDRTKTKSSYRTLPLVKPFEELLHRLKKQQEENRKLCGSAYCKKYIALTKLIPSLLVLVDEDKLAVSAAADYISVLTVQEQTDLASVMDRLDMIPVKGQLVKIKEQSKAGTLTITVIEAILSDGQPAAVQVILKQMRLRQYFPQTYTAQQMEEVIVSLLETWSIRY